MRMNNLKWIKAVVQLPRFENHLNFSVVLIGMLYTQFISASASSSLSSIIQILVTYFTFQISFYTIIYIMNEMSDIESDSKDIHKKDRAFASKTLTINDGYFIIFCLFNLTIISLKLFFDSKLIILSLLFTCFTIFNLIYSMIIKKYESLKWMRPFIGITATLRFNLGIICSSSMNSSTELAEFYHDNYFEILCISSLFFLGMSSTQCVKFMFESYFSSNYHYTKTFIFLQTLMYIILFGVNNNILHKEIKIGLGFLNIILHNLIFICPKTICWFKVRTIDEIKNQKEINYHYLTWKLLTENQDYVQIIIYWIIKFWTIKFIFH